MHRKLIITKPAYNDINQIFKFISNDNPTAAKKLLDVFEQKFNIIIKYPLCGFKPFYAKKDIRVCVVEKNYQIVYKIDNNNIVIVRILTRYQDICF